jgi:hypothetical protein
VSLIDDTRELAASLPANDQPDHHETSGLIGALFVVLEENGIKVSKEALDAARQAQEAAVLATGPRPAYTAETAAKLSELDRLLDKLRQVTGEVETTDEPDEGNGGNGGAGLDQHWETEG